MPLVSYPNLDTAVSQSRDYLNEKVRKGEIRYHIEDKPVEEEKKKESLFKRLFRRKKVDGK